MGERTAGMLEGCGCAVVLAVVFLVAGCCGLTWYGGRVTDQLEREAAERGAPR